MISDEKARLIVRVQPNSGKNEVLRFQDGILYVRVAAPPIKGKANSELVQFLSGILEVRKSGLVIEKGYTQKTKVLRFDTLTQGQVMKRIGELVTLK